jgi:hypothetical protein
MRQLRKLWMGRRLCEAIARNARMMAELDRLLRLTAPRRA